MTDDDYASMAEPLSRSLPCVVLITGRCTFFDENALITLGTFSLILQVRQKSNKWRI